MTGPTCRRSAPPRCLAVPGHHSARSGRRPSVRTGNRTCRRPSTHPSAPWSSPRHPRRPRCRTLRQSRPGRRSERPAGSIRTGDRWSCQAPISGQPAASTALRATFAACSPTCITQPITTSSTVAGSMPVRSISAFNVSAARSTGCQSLSRPFRRPSGVRMTSTMTAVGMAAVCSLPAPGLKPDATLERRPDDVRD